MSNENIDKIDNAQTGIKIEKLAEKFNFSKVAMSIRLKLALDVTTQQD